MINFNPQRSKILPLYEFQFTSRFLCPVWQKERRKEKEATRDTNKIHLRKERGTGNAASLIGPCRQPDKPHFRPIANKSLALFSSLSSSSSSLPPSSPSCHRRETSLKSREEITDQLSHVGNAEWQNSPQWSSLRNWIRILRLMINCGCPLSLTPPFRFSHKLALHSSFPFSPRFCFLSPFFHSHRFRQSTIIRRDAPTGAINGENTFSCGKAGGGGYYEAPFLGQRFFPRGREYPGPWDCTPDESSFVQRATSTHVYSFLTPSRFLPFSSSINK